MKKKRSISALLVMSLCISLCACGNSDAGDRSDATCFRLGFVNGLDSPNQIAAQRLDELLAERLPNYRIEIYPGGQLGGERDMIESVQLGTLDMTITATTPLTNFVPGMGAGELAYLIQDYDHADAVYQGEIGRQWLKECEEVHIKGLGFTEVGFRQLCANKKIASIGDLKGLKLRVMENDIHVAGWRAMGCNAVTMSWGDAYSGVQQGTIDAVEVPYTLIVSNGVTDICKNISETNHIYTAQAMLMSEWAWNKMSEAEQEIFAECAREACLYGKEYAREQNEICRQTCLDAGVTIQEMDLEPFREQAQTLYDQYDDQYGALITQIQALAR